MTLFFIIIGMVWDENIRKLVSPNFYESNFLLTYIKILCWLSQTSGSFLFKNFQGHISHFSRTPFSGKKEPWVYVLFSSTTTWAILSWRSFILGTWESGLDKVSTEIQGLSSTDCNFQGLSRPWTFYFKFQGLSRCVIENAFTSSQYKLNKLQYQKYNNRTFKKTKNKKKTTLVNYI